eukprot:8487648-Pyramimonas_sp.AAC.1
MGLDKKAHPPYRPPQHATSDTPPTSRDARRYQALDEARLGCETRAREAPDGVCFTVEDKDPNTLWMMNGVLHLARWLCMLARAPTRWRVVDSSQSAVVSWYRLLYDYTIPKSMRAKGEGPLNARHIP